MVHQRGVGVRARVRLPVNVAVWQSLRLAIDYVSEDPALSAWGTRASGRFPAEWVPERATRYCMIIAPAAEGGDFLDLASFEVARDRPACDAVVRRTGARERGGTGDGGGTGRVSYRHQS